VTVAPLVGLLVLVLVVVGVVWAIGRDKEAATTNNPSPTSPAPPASEPPAPTQSASPAAPTPEQPARERFEVIVLNQTQRAGLAASVAETLRSDGWVIASTGDFGGAVPATTVYFPPGGEAAASEIAGSLPVDPRVLPVFPAIDAERITVILTGNFA